LESKPPEPSAPRSAALFRVTFQRLSTQRFLAMVDGPWVGTWRPHRPRGPISAAFKSPGPKYALPPALGSTSSATHDPRKNIAPSFSFGVRHKEFTNNHSPGPKFNIESALTRHGRNGAPQYSLYSRSKSATAFNTPGPGTYRNEDVRASHKAAPAYSLTGRAKSGYSNKTPGPAAYMLPRASVNRHGTPAYSMRLKPTTGSFTEDLAKTPGPGTYKVTDPSTYKKKMPQYSLTARNELPSDSTRKPGPGAHRPEQVIVNKKIPPKYTFGVRHSEYAGTFVGAEKE